MQPTPYSASEIERNGTFYLLVRTGDQKFLCVRGDAAGFQERAFLQVDAHFFPISAENAAHLRECLPWLKPQPLGLKTSFGFGDRLGLATSGHIQSLQDVSIAPVFAQQSVRENARTGRTPQSVLDDAMWGIFQCGWRGAWGADADHLITINDIAPFVAAGYTFFTVDPGEHVDNAAHTDSLDALKRKVNALPWDVLQDTAANLRARYLNQSISVNGLTLAFTPETLFRAAAKYGRAVAHAAEMFREIARQKNDAFDFEVSVDETDTPTSIAEDFYVANELQRLHVRMTSIAPRFYGRFEKGVDFIGNLEQLRENLDQHARIARHFNSKLSLHSGSDKFSVYPLFATSTRGWGHVKTAGTSYLEALRTLALVEPKLFREILTLARERYPTDRATYHVSAEVERVRASDALQDGELAELLDQFDARELLHVTFGSALQTFGAEIHAALRANEDAYAQTLQRHFAEHLAALTTDGEQSPNPDNP